jgi:hypothetical protein
MNELDQLSFKTHNILLKAYPLDCIVQKNRITFCQTIVFAHRYFVYLENKQLESTQL